MSRCITLRSLGGVALVLAGALGVGCVSAETRIEPRIGVGGAYVSNVLLAPPGQEEDDWVGEIKPGITITHESARLKLDLDYDLQALYYADHGDYDDYFNEFLGSGVAELVKDRLFVDLDGRYEQRNVDPAGPAVTSNLYRSDNRTDLGSWQVSPWYRQPFGDVAEATLRYTYGQYNFRNVDPGAQDVSGSDVQDSDQQRIDVGFGSPQDAAGWTWRLDYLRNDVDYDASPDYRYERTGAEVGLPLGKRNHLLLAAGLESDFAGDPSAGGLDGDWWNVGWRWTPTERQTLEARVGDRFWGNDYLFSWKRKGARGDLALEYAERPQTFGALDFGDEGNLYGRTDTRAYVSKRLTGSMTWDAPRSDWRLQVYWDERDYFGATEDNDTFTEDEKYVGALAGVSWQALARTRLDFDARWYERSLEEGAVATVELSLALVRDITPQLEARLAGTWTDQDGDSDAFREFDAATAFLGIVWRRQ